MKFRLGVVGLLTAYVIFAMAAPMLRAQKSIGASGIVPADIASMNTGGWATIALALRAP